MSTTGVDAFSVMVTRTGSAGQELADLLQQRGIRSWFMPTLEIVGQELILPIEDFQQVIFVSPNAVKYSVEKSQAMRDLLPAQLIAVGTGTAKCLHQLGYNDVLVPGKHHSESLLELPSLQSVAGQHILIVRGRGGRTLIADTLTQRGAICHYLEVYGRLTARLDQNYLQEFLDYNRDDHTGKHNTRIVTIASVDALEALNANLGQGFDYGQLTLVVASQRIADSALASGYRRVVVANSASNQVMLDTIVEMIHK